MLKIDDFFKMMIKIFPNNTNKVNERMKDNFEGWDTIVIEEIIMPEVIELLKKDEDKEKLKEIFEYFEEICLYSDEYMNNVFSITVLEILGNEKSILETAKKYMGPETTKLQREADIAIGRQV